eukprot:m.225308 g.225308  ORF g.225308 m.225308 type:complete len:216 (-) comp17307_c0_seq9:150-797(-)
MSIKSYSAIEQALSAQQMSSFLDRLYKILDDQCKQQGLFRVATVGSTFMFASNMLEEQPYHLIRACKFAMAATEAVASLLLDPSDSSLGSPCLRTGIHSGSVVLNVIGTTDSPRFCVLGETVAIGKKIHQLAKDCEIWLSWLAGTMLQAQCASRGIHLDERLVPCGQVTFKVYGPMETYMLQTKQVSSSRSPCASKATTIAPTIQVRNGFETTTL